MSNPSMFRVSNGLATLGPDALSILQLLERRVLSWAEEIGAPECAYPPLQRIEDLSRIDYFLNFPHLGAMVTGLDKDKLSAHYGTDEAVHSVPCEHLADADFALPSAACYNVYFAHEDEQLAGPVYVTTIARCFRNEETFPDLSRLWGFQMREIVCIGTADDVQELLNSFRDKVKDFIARIGLPIEVNLATDPFFDRTSPRAVMQQVFPVKEEFVYGDSVAIASLNYHRNFFGERCRIRTADGEQAFTGCVAFGVERWLYALNEHFEGDATRIRKALEAAQA